MVTLLPFGMAFISGSLVKLPMTMALFKYMQIFLALRSFLAKQGLTCNFTNFIDFIDFIDFMDFTDFIDFIDYLFIQLSILQFLYQVPLH